MDPVQAQYEAYPYPGRDPGDEAKRLVTGSPSNLVELNHYLFAGRRDFRQPFRALAAGGGTGDAAIMMAQQLADCGGPGTVDYLDLSDAARGIAEARATARGLGNLTFHTGSLLDLPSLALGPFDYIDCCGVLHHLEDPAAGLRALADGLADGGGIGLMVYAPYGRTGVYPLQAMLRQIGNGLPLVEKIGIARQLVGALPQSNWFRRNPFLGDHRLGDAELVDLLLHERDRAFTVAELMALVEAAGLTPVALLEPARYRPASYLASPAVLKRLDGLDDFAAAAFAEALAGNIKKHVLYCTRRPEADACTARPDGPAAVPILLDLDGEGLAKAVERDLVLRADFDGLSLRFPLPRLAPAILRRIDGTRPLAAIHDQLQSLDPNLDWDTFLTRFRQLFDAVNGINRMFLRIQPDSRR